MKLDDALKGVESALEVLRSPKTMDDPATLSEQMYRLGQYAAAVENHLAVLEKEYYENESIVLGEQKDLGVNPTASEREVKIKQGAAKGEIKRLTRIVSAAWSVQMTAMAKIKHIKGENYGA